MANWNQNLLTAEKVPQKTMTNSNSILKMNSIRSIFLTLAIMRVKRIIVLSRKITFLLDIKIRIYKYGSGNSKVTSLPVNFLYTEANVSTCNNKIYIINNSKKYLYYYRLSQIFISKYTRSICIKVLKLPSSLPKGHFCSGIPSLPCYAYIYSIHKKAVSVTFN